MDTAKKGRSSPPSVIREFPVGARKFVKQSKMGLEWYWRYLAGNGVAAVINAR